MAKIVISDLAKYSEEDEAGEATCTQSNSSSMETGFEPASLSDAWIQAGLLGTKEPVQCIYSGPCDLRPLYLTIPCILRPDISNTTCIQYKYRSILRPPSI